MGQLHCGFWDPQPPYRAGFLLTSCFHTVTLRLGTLFRAHSNFPLSWLLQMPVFSSSIPTKLEVLNPGTGILSLPNLGQKSAQTPEDLATKLCLFKQVVTSTKTP